MTDSTSTTTQTNRTELSRRDRLAATAGLVAGSAGLGGVATTTATAQENGPTEIEDWFDLDAVREDLEDDYVLVDDLDGTTAGYDEIAGANADNGHGFAPIGDSDERFTGTFDGNGNEIRDLVIDREDENNVGLFGYAEGAAIRSVHVDVSISGGEHTGGIAGWLWAASRPEGATVESVRVTGTIEGGKRLVGGVVGLNHGTVSKASVDGAVSAPGGTEVGGIVGQNLDRVAKWFRVRTARSPFHQASRRIFIVETLKI